MERHILPADDEQVAELTTDILGILSMEMDYEANVHEGSETGETIIQLSSGRRFRIQLWEIL